MNTSRTIIVLAGILTAVLAFNTTFAQETKIENDDDYVYLHAVDYQRVNSKIQKANYKTEKAHHKALKAQKAAKFSHKVEMKARKAELKASKAEKASKAGHQAELKVQKASKVSKLQTKSVMKQKPVKSHVKYIKKSEFD
jgi:hypothetical protein